MGNCTSSEQPAEGRTAALRRASSQEQEPRPEQSLWHEDALFLPTRDDELVDIVSEKARPSYTGVGVGEELTVTLLSADAAPSHQVEARRDGAIHTAIQRALGLCQAQLEHVVFGEEAIQPGDTFDEHGIEDGARLMIKVGPAATLATIIYDTVATQTENRAGLGDCLAGRLHSGPPDLNH